FGALCGKSGYLAFYSARAAVQEGLVKLVGSCPLSKDVPRNTRRAGARGRTGKILTWIIETDGHELMRTELSEAERQLPIAAVWDHALLAMRISEGWSPEKEG